MHQYRFVRLRMLLSACIVVFFGLNASAAARWEFSSKAPNPHRGAYTVSKGDIVYFFGDDLNAEYESPVPSFDHVWLLNSTSLEWSWVKSSGDIPQRRGYFCSYIIEDHIYIFGGISWAGLVASNEMYAMNMGSFAWKKIEYATINKPKPIMQSACASHKDKLYILGGYEGNPTPAFWDFNITTKTWGKISPKPDNKDYAAYVSNTQMSSYKDSIILFGGCDVSYYFISKLWTFNLTTYEWKEPIDFSDLGAVIYTMAIRIHKTKLYIFGGTFDFGLSQLSGNLVVIDLVSSTAQVISSEHHNFLTNYPIITPVARIHVSSAVSKDKFLIFGGKNDRRMNDFWVFDPATMKWIDSSVSRYPIGRTHPHLASMSENKVAMYGGQIYLDKAQPINDLWIYQTDSDSWERIVQESVCLPTQANCGPAVLHAAFGYHESSFFLIGGYFPDNDAPIFKTYSLMSKTWNNIKNLQVPFLGAGSRYHAASACVGPKIFIWGGTTSGENLASDSLFVFDMENETGAVINDSANAPAPRSQPKGFSMNGHFCFMDKTSQEAHGNNREIWCYDGVSNTWNRTETIASHVPNNAILAGFSTSLIVVGGLDADENMVNTFHINNVKSKVWEKLQIEPRPPPIVDSSAIINYGSIFLFGGVSNDPVVATGSVYRLELSKLWCDGRYEVKSSDATLSDGSGSFDYFPATQCSWNIQNTNFIVVEEIEIAPGALLSIETVSECDKGIIFGDTISNKMEISSLTKGSVVEIPSFKSLLTFQVSKNATPAQGFKFKMFACNKGFMADMNGCFCDKDHYVNFRGDCIACPTGSQQPLQNQQTCIKDMVDEKQHIDTGMIGQTNLVQLSSDLPPIVFGSGCVIDSAIYIMGGSSSTDTNKVDKFYPLDEIYFTNSPVESSWGKMEMKGDIPASRVHFCLVGMDGYAVLIGGKSSVRDAFIYLLEPSRYRWTRKSAMPSQIIGGMCTRKEDSIYLFGGIDENGLSMNTLHKYNPGLDLWESVKLVGNVQNIAFGSMVLYGRSLILFGGTNGQDENDSVISINLDSLDVSSTKSIKLEKCIECDEEGGICRFSRRNFVFGIHENKLHIYGGMREGDVLADVNIIDLETSEVVFRENYGLNSPELPLSQPPPKFGAVFVVVNSSMMIVGGASKSNIVTNDVWTWDSDIQTWSDSSVSRSPIYRVDASFIKTSEKSFLIFGGATEYIEETLLNDIWEFDIVNQTWVCLFAGSSTLGPPPRARAMISRISNTIYIYGGRTESGKADDRVWIFDLGEKKWAIKDHINMLSTYQRPFNRIGISSVQTKNKLWMWGGQIIEGTKKTEFYSAALVFDTTRSLVYADNITGILPPKRSYHAVCNINEDKILVFGGKDLSAKNINDAWIYDIGLQTWNSIDYASRLSIQLSNPTCGGFGAYSVIDGINVARGDKTSIMLQHDFQRASNLLVSTKLHGYDSMYKQSSGTFGNLVISFGGTNGYSTTNQIIAYRPGFCSSTPKLVRSEIIASAFDDGSGDGMYLENSNCTWALSNATHIILQKDIRDIDRVIIYSLVDGKMIQLSYSTKSPDNKKEMYESASGFVVRFVSAQKRAPYSNSPCEGCEGFTITHAACPIQSTIDPDSYKCECGEGYTLQEDLCVKDIKDSHSTPVNYYGIIGGVVGGVLFVGIFGGYYYRKKMNESMKGTEKKLYGIIDPNELVYGKLLGSGSFGEVFQGEWRGTEVAIKVLIRNKMNKEQIESFKREVAIMVELRHPNIVLYMGACFETENPCLVCELMHEGTLYDVLHQEKSIPYTQRLSFMLDISKGMQYLHMSNPPIIHRDLKSLNVLVDDRFRLKVSDFGLTAIQGKNNAQEQIGSLLWLAPEVIEGKEYAMCADVYSFGIIAWEIITRKDPYYEIENAISIPTQVVMNELRPTMSKNVPQEVQNIIKDLWHQNPLQRPTFQDASKRLSNLLDSSHNSSNFSFGDIASEEAPPKGNVSVVCTRVSRSERLWEDVPEVMAESVSMFTEKLKKINQKHRGYISQNDGENFVIVFQTNFDAIQFCSEVQWEMNWLEWPAELQFHELCKPTADGDLKGLRIQMGVDYGICSQRSDGPKIGSQYSGKCVSGAMKLSRISQGGQILVSENVYHDLSDKMDILKVENFIRSLPLKGGNTHQIYEICPKKLSKRATHFEQLQAQSVSSLELNENKEFGDDGHILNTPSPSFHKTGEYSTKGTTNTTSSVRESGTTSKNAKGKSDEKLRLRDRYEWEVDFEELVMEKKELGSGSFGSVFCAVFRGRRVAAKKIGTGNFIRDQTYIAFLCEVALLRRLKHPNIIEFIGASTERPNLYIIMEIVEPGSLRSLLQNMDVKITQIEKKRMIDGIISGMAYLHSLNPIVLHRDLKSANVLVNDKFESKICDFGLARIKENNRTMTKCGTMVYQAPEVMKGKRYNEKADVYSFGVLLWEIETRETPYQGRDPLVLQFQVMNGLRPEIRSNMESLTVEIIKRCWNANPELRPNFRDLMSATPNDVEVIDG